MLSSMHIKKGSNFKFYLVTENIYFKTGIILKPHVKLFINIEQKIDGISVSDENVEVT